MASFTCSNNKKINERFKTGGSVFSGFSQGGTPINLYSYDANINFQNTTPSGFKLNGVDIANLFSANFTEYSTQGNALTGMPYPNTVKVEMVGGCGSGGSAGTSQAYEATGASGSGGGGSAKFIGTYNNIDSFTINQVGVGGAGSTYRSNGNAGSSSTLTLDGYGTISCFGGGAGLAGDSANYNTGTELWQGGVSHAGGAAGGISVNFATAKGSYSFGLGQNGGDGEIGNYDGSGVAGGAGGNSGFSSAGGSSGGSSSNPWNYPTGVGSESYSLAGANGYVKIKIYYP